MNRLRLFLVCLLALATASVTLVAAQRAQAAVGHAAAAGFGHTVLEDGNAAQFAATAKRCLRAALPGAPCGIDLAQPVRDTAGRTPLLLRPGRPDGASARLSGREPACLLGPPRSC